MISAYILIKPSILRFNSPGFSTMTINNRYKNHRVFEKLSKYAVFYKDLANSVFNFSSQGTTSIANIDTYVYSSIQGTLESIRTILLQGRINDAYSLLRKYYDLIIINVYTNLYLNDHFSVEHFIVDKINNWVKGQDKLPQYREMITYVRESDKLARINKLLENDDIYKNLRNRCNNYTHYNFYVYVLLNDNEINLPNRVKVLDIFFEDLVNLFVMHLSYIFYLNDHYMMSSDYIDCLEMGITPEADSQYYVAPFIQEIFDSEIKTKRMDIAKEIISNSSMMLK